MSEPVPVIGLFGSSRLTLTYAARVPDGAVVLDEDDDMLLEDAYVAALHGGAKVFAPPSAEKASVAVWTVASELARGGPVTEAAFVFTDRATMEAHAAALSALLKR